jgi:LmbE family N-acetylglucosaminyl deacetylase
VRGKIFIQLKKIYLSRMDKNNSGRRGFIRSSVFGLGSISLSPLVSSTKISSAEKKEPGKLNIVCVGAHPGDPEFGCGGTMAKYSKAGNKVIFLYLTRGEAYNDKQSYNQSAALRTKEAEKSCKILQATPLFAGQIDGNTELNKQRNEEATKLIFSQQPDIVFTHWPVDSHPDHQVAGLLALTAWIRSNKKFHLYFYEVNTGSETMGFSPSDYVDITDVREIKKAAMFAHQTQQPQEIYDSFFKTMEEFRGLEAGVKAAEAFMYFKPGDERSIIKGL